MASVPDDYFTAREQFRAAAARLGWTCQAYPVGAEGPDGRALTVDVAISPGPGAEGALVVSSGLHGVEGPIGSAIQLRLLQRWAHAGPPGRLRRVLVHALNPYGFAWCRRVDADNVDPNRNFLVEPDAVHRGSPEAYRRIDAWLNAPHPPRRGEPFRVRVLLAAIRYGPGALTRALATGQYDYPKGLFFGGHGPSPTCRIAAEHLASWIGGARRVFHLDVHTGLGRWGTCRLIADYPLTPSQRDRLTRWFGAEAFVEVQPEGGGYMARGSLGPWCVAQGVAPDYLFTFAEFGTYGSLSVLAGLRAENQTHHWGRANEAAGARAGARLRELFCPNSEAWRARTVARGVDLVERAAAGLAAEVPPDGPPAPVPALSPRT